MKKRIEGNKEEEKKNDNNIDENSRKKSVC